MHRDATYRLRGALLETGGYAMSEQTKLVREVCVAAERTAPSSERASGRARERG